MRMASDQLVGNRPNAVGNREPAFAARHPGYAWFSLGFAAFVTAIVLLRGAAQEWHIGILLAGLLMVWRGERIDRRAGARDKPIRRARDRVAWRRRFDLALQDRDHERLARRTINPDGAFLQGGRNRRPGLAAPDKQHFAADEQPILPLRPLAQI